MMTMQSKRKRSGKKSLLGREERHPAALDTLGTAAVRAIELAVLPNNFPLCPTYIATLSALRSAALGRVSSCSIRCRHLRCHCSYASAPPCPAQSSSLGFSRNEPRSLGSNSQPILYFLSDIQAFNCCVGASEKMQLWIRKKRRSWR